MSTNDAPTEPQAKSGPRQNRAQQSNNKPSRTSNSKKPHSRVKEDSAATDIKSSETKPIDKVSQLLEAFPDWTRDDLVDLLNECSGDVELAGMKIISGQSKPFQQFGKNQKKSSVVPESAVPETVASTTRSSHFDSSRPIRGGRGGAVRGRGGSHAPERGRGTRGGRGGSRAATASLVASHNSQENTQQEISKVTNSSTITDWPSSSNENNVTTEDSSALILSNGNKLNKTTAPKVKSWAQIVRPATPEPIVPPQVEVVEVQQPEVSILPNQTSVKDDATWDTGATSSKDWEEPNIEQSKPEDVSSAAPVWNKEPSEIVSGESIDVPDTEKLWNSATIVETPVVKLPPKEDISQPVSAMWNETSIVSPAWDSKSVSNTRTVEDANAPPGFAKSSRSGPLRTGRRVDQDAPIVMGAGTGAPSNNKLPVQFGSLSLMGEDAADDDIKNNLSSEQTSQQNTQKLKTSPQQPQAHLSNQHSTQEQQTSQQHGQQTQPAQNPQYSQQYQYQQHLPQSNESKIAPDPSIVSMSQMPQLNHTPSQGYQSQHDMYNQHSNSYSLHHQQPQSTDMYGYGGRDMLSMSQHGAPGYGATPQHLQQSAQHHQNALQQSNQQVQSPNDHYQAQFGHLYPNQESRGYADQQSYNSSVQSFGGRSSVLSPQEDVSTKATSVNESTPPHNTQPQAQQQGYTQPMQTYGYPYGYTYHNPYGAAQYFQHSGSYYSKPSYNPNMYQTAVQTQSKATGSNQPTAGYTYGGSSYTDDYQQDFNKYGAQIGQQSVGGGYSASQHIQQAGSNAVSQSQGKGVNYDAINAKNGIVPSVPISQSQSQQQAPPQQHYQPPAQRQYYNGGMTTSGTGSAGYASYGSQANYTSGGQQPYKNLSTAQQSQSQGQQQHGQQQGQQQYYSQMYHQ